MVDDEEYDRFNQVRVVLGKKRSRYDDRSRNTHMHVLKEVCR